MQNMKVKQSVEYNGKRYTLPFLVAKESLSTEQETVRNRFGGESCTLPAFAVAVGSSGNATSKGSLYSLLLYLIVFIS